MFGSGVAKENELEGNLFELDDMIYRQDGGKIYAGGFQISSHFMEKGISPVSTMNAMEGEMKGGNSVDDLFRHLVIPAGLIHFQMKPNDAFFEPKHEMLNDDIYDALFAMVNLQQKKKMTRRNNANTKTNKRTKRNRNNR
jgi:hypothetical protein